MNIITVMSDEHSYQMMQFIDHSILKTPNLDRLAAESTVFDNCYTVLSAHRPEAVLSPDASSTGSGPGITLRLMTELFQGFPTA